MRWSACSWRLSASPAARYSTGRWRDPPAPPAGALSRGWSRPSASAAATRCRRQLPAVEIARSAGQYDGSLRHIIHAFKYEHRRALALPLARLMLDAGGEVLGGADALVPVPLSWRRALDRGFNQADDLARHLGLPVRRVLRRTRHGPPQAGLPAAGRHANVRGAYAATRWRRRAIQDRVLVLVDDVMTTGATLDACADALVSAGARSVRALTIARAVAAPPPGSQFPRRLSTARHR
jgi:ComF family protein